MIRKLIISHIKKFKGGVAPGEGHSRLQLCFSWCCPQACGNMEGAIINKYHIQLHPGEKYREFLILCLSLRSKKIIPLPRPLLISQWPEFNGHKSFAKSLTGKGRKLSVGLRQVAWDNWKALDWGIRNLGFSS